MNFCYHTYLRWAEKSAVCAVCGEKFPEYEFTNLFTGTFPRDKYENWWISRMTTTIASTSTTARINWDNLL